MSGSYVAPGTEEEGDMLPSPAAASATASDGEVRGGDSPRATPLLFSKKII